MSEEDVIGFSVRLVYTGDPDEVLDWVFTFGCGHVHPITGAPLDNRFVRIRGTYASARAEMFERFGPKWAHNYPSEDEAGVARYDLLELEQTDVHIEVLKARQAQIRARTK